eukprot:403345989
MQDHVKTSRKLQLIKDPTDILKLQQRVNQTLDNQNHTNEFFKTRNMNQTLKPQYINSQTATDLTSSAQRIYNPKPFTDLRQRTVANYDEYILLKTIERQQKQELRDALVNQINSKTKLENTYTQSFQKSNIFGNQRRYSQNPDISVTSLKVGQIDIDFKNINLLNKNKGSRNGMNQNHFMSIQNPINENNQLGDQNLGNLGKTHNRSYQNIQSNNIRSNSKKQFEIKSHSKTPLIRSLIPKNDQNLNNNNNIYQLDQLPQFSNHLNVKQRNESTYLSQKRLIKQQDQRNFFENLKHQQSLLVNLNEIQLSQRQKEASSIDRHMSQQYIDDYYSFQESQKSKKDQQNSLMDTYKTAIDFKQKTKNIDKSHNYSLIMDENPLYKNLKNHDDNQRNETQIKVLKALEVQKQRDNKFAETIQKDQKEQFQKRSMPLIQNTNSDEQIQKRKMQFKISRKIYENIMKQSMLKEQEEKSKQLDYKF